MGYACPVCETPQMDAEHLANHLAFTAILGDEAHEDWLEEHVPDWEELNEETLGERATEYAEAEEFPQVFEDTVHDDHDHDTERSGALFEDDDLERPARGASTPTAPDSEVEQVLEEARELTERRRANARDGDESEDADAADGETE